MSTDAAPVLVVFPDVGPDRRSEAQDRGFTQGHAAGYAAGLRAAAVEQARQAAGLQAEHDAAMAAGRQSTERAVAVLAAAAAAFQQRFRLVLQDAETVLAASALELAEAVLGYELDDGERTARAALHRALSSNGSGSGSGDASPVVAAVRLHPADIAVLEAAGIPAVPDAAGTGVELVPDPSLARGDAMAQYPQGWLDARLGTALDRARAELLGDPALLGEPS